MPTASVETPTPPVPTPPRSFAPRPRRNLLPLLFVGLLGLLAAGAAVLAGAFEAPSTVDLTVHNAAGETLGASTVKGTYTSSTLGGDTLHFRYQSPDRVTAYFSGPAGQLSHRPQTATGPTASQVLLPIKQLEQFDGFRAHGSVYVLTESIKQLVPPADRSRVRGTIRASATLATGYVVRVQEHISGTETQGGHTRRIADLMDYRLSRVDAWTAS